MLPPRLRRRVDALRVVHGAIPMPGSTDGSDHRRCAPWRSSPRRRRTASDCASTTPPATARRPPDRRAPPPRHPRSALVSRGLGPRPRGLAHLPRRPAARCTVGPLSLRTARGARAATPTAFVRDNLRSMPTRYAVDVTIAAPAATVSDWARRTGHRSRRSTTSRAGADGRGRARLAGHDPRRARRGGRGPRPDRAARAAGRRRRTVHAGRPRCRLRDAMDTAHGQASFDAWFATISNQNG